MAYDEATAARVRQALAAVDGAVEKRMFGGLVFMVNGNMCCGVDQGNLMLRVGPAQYAAALEEPDAGVMDFTGRPMLWGSGSARRWLLSRRCRPSRGVGGYNPCFDYSLGRPRDVL